MGTLFSRRKNTGLKRHYASRHQVVTSNSEDCLLVCSSAPSVKERKQNFVKNSSSEEIDLKGFEDYVISKKEKKKMSSNFVEECLAAHNEYRKDHDAKPLKLKEDLNRHAQQWANKLAASGKLKHSNNRSFGENVAMTSYGNPSGQEITAMWYDEIKKYNFRSPGFKSGTGHFTQVVWKGSTHLGVGIGEGKNGTFVVANYEPAGNVTNSGYFEKNVSPPNKKVKAGHKERSRRDSSSSSSSSSSDDESRSKPASLRGGKKTETKVETKVKESTDSQGRKVRETTKITTTITTEGGSKSTSTKTDVQTEYLSGGGGASSNTTGDPVDATGIGSMNIGSYKSSMTDMDRRQFRKECLKRHNELRKKHDTSSLVMDETLEKTAQMWADHCAKISRMQHSSGNDYGENVAYKFSSNKRTVKGDEICDMWYNEIKDYKFSRHEFSSNTGHFTQVVWADSKKIGIGVADDGQGSVYAVANYHPAGNFRNKFEENVKRPRR